MLKFFSLLLFLLICTKNANGYVGLGPLLPLIGSILTYVFITIIFLLGIVLYPLSKFYKFIKFKKKNEKKDQ